MYIIYMLTEEICFFQTPSLRDTYNPNILQTTVASKRSKLSAHTVPHWPLWYTSTLPPLPVELPAKRSSENQRN